MYCQTLLIHQKIANILPWLSKDIFIKALLSGRKSAFQDVFVLFGQLFFYIPFGAPQDERLNHLQFRVTRYHSGFRIANSGSAGVKKSKITRLCTNPMKADNQLVAVVLVLVSTCLNWKVRVWLGDSR